MSDNSAKNKKIRELRRMQEAHEARVERMRREIEAISADEDDIRLRKPAIKPAKVQDCVPSWQGRIVLEIGVRQPKRERCMALLFDESCACTRCS